MLALFLFKWGIRCRQQRLLNLEDLAVLTTSRRSVKQRHCHPASPKKPPRMAGWWPSSVCFPRASVRHGFNLLAPYYHMMSIEDRQRMAASLLERLAQRKVFFTTSWDDGLRTDLPLVELGQKHRIPMMLFVCPRHPNGKAMTSGELRQVANGAEIGSHTLTHTPIDHCSPAVAREEVLAGRVFVEGTLGRPVPHFALVGGRYSSANLNAIAALFDSVRSTHAFNFFRPAHGALIKPSLQVRFDGRTHPPKMLWEAFMQLSFAGLLRVASRVAVGQRQHDMLAIIPEICAAPEIYLHLWGHSEEIEECDAWRDLESIFSVLNAKM